MLFYVYVLFKFYTSSQLFRIGVVFLKKNAYYSYNSSYSILTFLGLGVFSEYHTLSH